MESYMTLRLSAAVAAAMLLAVSPAPAESLPPSDAPIVLALDSEAPPRRSRKKREGVSERILSPRQLALRERQRKCSAEWKSAKSAGTLEKGLRWPKFWSQCNGRLKGNSA
jgi:hypothetical protein